MLTNNYIHCFTVELLEVQCLIKIISIYFYCTLRNKYTIKTNRCVFSNRSTYGTISYLNMRYNYLFSHLYLLSRICFVSNVQECPD